MISIMECQDRSLYLLRARNMTIGMFSFNSRGFYGIRSGPKGFYIDHEHHFEMGPPFGTAKPLILLEDRCPIFVPIGRDESMFFRWLFEMNHKLETGKK